MAEPTYTVASDSETSGVEKTSSASPEVAIGIDIGTSHCSVAVWNGSQVELLRSRNQKLMRSYVTFKDDTPSGGVSNQLSQEYEMLSGAAVFNIIRLIGRVDTDPVVHASKSLPFLVQTLDIGVRPFIAAFQLTRMERACAMAGLHVLRSMPEPTAVALLYAQQQNVVHESTVSASEKIALIFNMGAGYCDVALTATAGGVSQIKALSGSAIGGEDMLQNLMHHLLPNMDSLFSGHGINEIKSMGLFRVAIQDAIHKLSSETSVQVDVDLGNGTKICTVVDREEFEEVNKNVFEKCETLIKQCLRDAKTDVLDVNDVILVGGCSSIPKIRNLVLGTCKSETINNTEMNPWEAAVRGAALEGAIASGVSDPLGSLDLLTIQVIPQSIGIRAEGNTFVPIINRNTTMPSRKDLTFTTAHDNQAEALIVVYEGVPEINVGIDIDTSNVLRVFAGVLIPGTQQPVNPFMEVRMPTVDDGHGWCAEALLRKYGSTVALVPVQKKIQQ
ncbi:heat-shock protein 70T-2 [Actinidia rufa]|uniref:Heat-shock protein 70T-2 n=1 Tax=Actinidia rufa TaxID=165716 RepID=A0A7J0GDG2_9ERIC|nr:heat-shock protein 70T-2 [Actinidia rufa]